MPSVLVRNLDEATVSLLKRRAAEKGHSLQQEVRAILEKAAAEADDWTRREAAIAVADEIRNRLAASGRTFPDSTPLIRALRDNDGHLPDGFDAER
jgi:plasmid stability protein